MSTDRRHQGIAGTVVRAGAWTYGRTLFAGCIHIGVTAVLARQLTPAEFGVVALAQVALQLLTVVGAQGVSDFVIYDHAAGREQRVEAAFWMDLAFSGAAAVLGLLVTSRVAAFYGEPQLGPLLAAMLLRYPMDSVAKVPDALLKRCLDFRSLAVRDSVLDILSALTSVGLALLGWGAWSLVVPGLVAAPIRAWAVFRIAKWRPGLALRVSLWPRIFSYSAKIVGTSLTTFIVNQGDSLLIGKLLGSHALGIYNVAWMNANFVSRNLSTLASKLAMPALSAISGDLDRLRLGLNRMLRVLAIVTCPALIGLFVLADDFILTVYGPQWTQAIVPLRIMIVFALRYAVGSPAGGLFNAVGRPDVALRLGLLQVPFFLVSIWIGSRFGLVGVAAAVTIVRTTFGLVVFDLVAKCTKQTLSQVVAPLVPPLAASACMGAAIYSAEWVLRALWHLGPLENLALLVLLGTVVYLMLLRTAYHSLAEDLARAVQPLLGRFQPAIGRLLAIREPQRSV